MKTKEKYQLFPALTAQQYKLLEDDIKARGVMVAVEVDENGNILDGHHRVAIAEKHGKTYKTVTRQFSTEEQKKDHIIKLNLARRQMAEHVWGMAFKKLCESRGVRLGRGGPGRGQGPKPKQSKATLALDSKPDNTIASLAEEVGVTERTAKRRLKAAREYETLSDQLRSAVDSGNKKVRDVRKECPEPKAKKPKPPPRDSAREAQIVGIRNQVVECPQCGHKKALCAQCGARFPVRTSDLA